MTWFGGLALTREDDGTTTLRPAVRDQAELHGLLTKIRDLGVTSSPSRPSTPRATPIPRNSNTNRPPGSTRRG